MTSAPTQDPRERLRRSTIWIVGAGALFAILAALIGQILISWQLGDSQAVVARAAREVRQTFDTSAAELKRVAEGMAARRTVATGLDSPEESDASRQLFDQVELAARSIDTPGFALTILDDNGRALAWSGPSSDIPLDRATGPAALFVSRGPLGLRLIYVEPVFLPASMQGPGRPNPRRLGAIAAEQPISSVSPANATDRQDFPLLTSIGAITLRQTFNAGSRRRHAVAPLLRAPSGETLLEAVVPAGAAEALARALARLAVRGGVPLARGDGAARRRRLHLLSQRHARARRAHRLHRDDRRTVRRRPHPLLVGRDARRMDR